MPSLRGASFRDIRRLSRKITWALIALEAAALVAGGMGALLKPDPSYWCPELSKPAWVMLLEYGQGAAIGFAVLSAAPTLLARRRSLAILWLFAGVACVAITVVRAHVEPTGCG